MSILSKYPIFTDYAQALIRKSFRKIAKILRTGLSQTETLDRYSEENLQEFEAAIDEEWPQSNLHLSAGFDGESFARNAGLDLDLLPVGYSRIPGKSPEIRTEVRISSCSIPGDLAEASRHLRLLEATIKVGREVESIALLLCHALNDLKRENTLIDPDKEREREAKFKRSNTLRNNCDDSQARDYFCDVLMPAFVEVGTSSTLHIRIETGKPRKYLKTLEKMVRTKHIRGKLSHLALTAKGLTYVRYELEVDGASLGSASRATLAAAREKLAAS
jgi:hypothetical protein